MGCLSVGFKILGHTSIDTYNINGCNVGYVEACGCKVGYTHIGELHLGTEKINKIDVDLFFVCKVGTKEYLKVTPSEPLWIDVNNDGTYTVRSNTNWILQ